MNNDTNLKKSIKQLAIKIKCRQNQMIYSKKIYRSIVLFGILSFVFLFNQSAYGADGITETYGYTKSVKVYTVPVTGKYKLEVWGAQGGSVTRGAKVGKGGKGGYSKGELNLTAGTKLYICVGQQGPTGNDKNWAYNGGGARLEGDCWGYFGGAGGGATHIAITNNRGELYEYESNKSEVLIVAGGGGGCAGGNDGVYDYPTYNGGGGGGNTGSNGGGGLSTGGTQTGPGATNGNATAGSYTPAAFGYGASCKNEGGGRRRLVWWWKWKKSRERN